MGLERWDEKSWGPLNEANMRRKLEEEGYSATRYTYPPKTFFPDHRHDVDKKDTVLHGRFRIRMDGLDVVLGPGDMIAVPRGALHSAEVIGDEAVVSLDAVRR